MATESVATIQYPNIQNFNLYITVHVAPSDVDSFFYYFDRVLAEVQKEPDLAYFEVFRDPESPGTISWTENWNQSTKWLFEVQLHKEYYKEYLEKTEAMFIKPREAHFKERLGGKYVLQRAGNVE